ncbi:MAG: PP2C family protein-serine/threonine phosphatase [Rhodospirillaceae bacterium]
MGANQLIGEIAVFCAAPRTATVMARGAVRLLRISGKDLIALLETTPQAARILLADLGRRLATVNQPLAFLSLAAQSLRRDDFDTEMLKVLVSCAGDLGPFARSFEEMVREIEAKHLRQQEMAMAMRIQQSVLPRPLDDGGLPFSLSAFMRPTREVGGDLYDYFRIDERRFAVVIADVSGKGVPASLFMMMCRTVLRSVAGSEAAADRCVARANRLLAEDNELCVFVTLFFGILDLETGVLGYCNAGHNPPFLRRADGRLEELAATGPAVAAFDAARYAAAETALAPGDLLFLYTDGITEAVDRDGGLFGTARLAALLQGETDPAHAVGAVSGAVDGFAAGMPQADDITCLALAWQPRRSAPPAP